MDEKPTTYEAYDKMAEQYAETVKHKPHNAYLERPAVRALVPDITGGKVLDAGCGSGINIGWLLEQGAREVIGVDASPQMIAIAQRGANPQTTLTVADLSHPLDFLETGTLDLVFSSLVVHYIADLETLFAEFARILRPSGGLVFSTHHPHDDHRRHPGNYFETVFVSEEWSGFGEERVTVSFYRRPLSAITEALFRAGFVIEHLTEAQPTDEFRQADPVGYERARQRTSFLCIRARRS